MVLCFFFFKRKTAYVMRISDWSSDVCSSDLLRTRGTRALPVLLLRGCDVAVSATLRAASRLEARGANAYNSHLHLRRTRRRARFPEEFHMFPKSRAPRAVFAAACAALLLAACGREQAPADTSDPAATPAAAGAVNPYPPRAPAPPHPPLHP